MSEKIQASKAKAKELIEKFKAINGFNQQPEYAILKAKESATFLCDEKINEFNEMNNNKMGLQFKHKILFWQAVKTSIQNHE